jgi:hypothetical protein
VKNPLIISHLASLLLAGAIYLFFRDPELIFFGWIDQLGLSGTIDALQSSLSEIADSLPSWSIYSLPDGLWLFSYMCLMLFIWRKSLTNAALFWVFLLPAFAFILEIGQGMNWFSGTFDIIDVLFYCFATLLPFVLYRKRINFIPNSKIQHEK